ncbi:MAG: PspC domain-containing protein [Bacteroidetes bacterium]|nr:MAG: PspC domain-containing protein [Bacteroidota bacterium]
MKKTVTANISGIVFHIDEDAYERLNLYLARIREKLSSEDGTDEILSDIESRIAEMFQEKITASKTVITISDVKEVTEQLGEPEQFDESEEPSDKKKERSSYNEKTQKRLFRDPDDKYLAGVAGGLGAFFNLDPVWIRAAFIVFTFVYGFGPLLYIVLWIVVPRASTTAERLEMRGEKVNISNIEKSIKEELNEIKDNLKEFSKETRDSFKSTSKKKRVSEAGNRLARALGIAAGIVLLVFAFSMLMAVISSIFLLPFTIYASSGVLQFSIPEMLNVFLPSPFISQLATSGIFLIIGIPIFWIFMLAIQLLFDLRARFKTLGVITLILWLSGIGMVVFAGISGARYFTNQYSYSEIHPVTPIQSNEIFLDFNKQQANSWNLYDHNGRLSHWRIMWKDGEFGAAGVPHLQIKPTQEDQISMTVITEARGVSRSAAIEHTSSISYIVQQQDSLLVFDPLFFYDKKDGWRGQKVYIELLVPEEKTVVLPKQFRQKMNVQWSRNVKVREGG